MKCLWRWSNLANWWTRRFWLPLITALLNKECLIQRICPRFCLLNMCTKKGLHCSLLYRSFSEAVCFSLFQDFKISALLYYLFWRHSCMFFIDLWCHWFHDEWFCITDYWQHLKCTLIQLPTDSNFGRCHFDSWFSPPTNVLNVPISVEFPSTFRKMWNELRKSTSQSTLSIDSFKVLSNIISTVIFTRRFKNQAFGIPRHQYSAVIDALVDIFHLNC